MGNKEDFIAALKNNEGLIYKVAAVYTNTTDDRKDLVQEIVYQLWKSFNTFENRASVSTWMYRVAMNVAIYHLKVAGRRVPTTPLETYKTETLNTDHDTFNEQWLIVKQHLQHLNLLDKGIVVLYLESKSYTEIADIIGISASSVGTRLSRIKEKLRNKIIKQDHGTR